MTYALCTTANGYNMSEGMHVLLVCANDITGGILVPLILFGFFCITMIGSYMMQKKMSGIGDAAGSFAVAAYLTAGASVIMLLIPKLINPLVTIICVAIAIVATAILIFSNMDQ